MTEFRFGGNVRRLVKIQMSILILVVSSQVSAGVYPEPAAAIGALSSCEFTLGFNGNILEARPIEKFHGRKLETYSAELQERVRKLDLKEGQMWIIDKGIDQLEGDGQVDLFAKKIDGQIYLFAVMNFKSEFHTDLDTLLDFELLLRLYEFSRKGALGPLKIPRPIMKTENQIWLEYIPGEGFRTSMRDTDLDATEKLILYQDYTEMVTQVAEAVRGNPQFYVAFKDRSKGAGVLDLMNLQPSRLSDRQSFEVAQSLSAVEELEYWLNTLKILDFQGAPDMFEELFSEFYRPVSRDLLYLNGDTVRVEEGTGQFYYRFLGFRSLDWEEPEDDDDDEDDGLRSGRFFGSGDDIL